MCRLHAGPHLGLEEMGVEALWSGGPNTHIQNQTLFKQNLQLNFASWNRGRGLGPDPGSTPGLLPFQDSVGCGTVSPCCVPFVSLTRECGVYLH